MLVGCMGNCVEEEMVRYKHVDLFLLLASLKVVTSNIHITYAIWPNLLHEC